MKSFENPDLNNKVGNLEEKVVEPKNTKRGVFDNIKRKGKGVAAMVALSSVLASAAEAKPLDLNQDTRKVTTQSLEKKEIVPEREKGRSLEILNDLMRVESDENEKNLIVAAEQKKDTAMILLGAFSLEIKAGFPEGGFRLSGTVGIAERLVAVKVLNKYLDEFIDSKFGNGDGKMSATEMTKFRSSVKDYPGLEMLFQELERAKLR